MNVKGASGKASDRNEEHVIGPWRKGDLIIKRQRTWMNCALLGGKWNLKAVNLALLLR